jgi:hypothetical protein
MARREELETTHGVVFSMLGSNDGYKSVARWIDADSGKRMVSSPDRVIVLIGRLEALFAGDSEDTSWFRAEEVNQ